MLARLLGCPLSPSVNLELCLQKANPEEIVTKQHEITLQPAVLKNPFVPHDDGYFLPHQPEVGVCVISTHLVEKLPFMTVERPKHTAL